MPNAWTQKVVSAWLRQLHGREPRDSAFSAGSPSQSGTARTRNRTLSPLVRVVYRGTTRPSGGRNPFHRRYFDRAFISRNATHPSSDAGRPCINERRLTPRPGPPAVDVSEWPASARIDSSMSRIPQLEAARAMGIARPRLSSDRPDTCLPRPSPGAVSARPWGWPSLRCSRQSVSKSPRLSVAGWLGMQFSGGTA